MRKCYCVRIIKVIDGFYRPQSISTSPNDNFTVIFSSLRKAKAFCDTDYGAKVDWFKAEDGLQSSLTGENCPHYFIRFWEVR